MLVDVHQLNFLRAGFADQELGIIDARAVAACQLLFKVFVGECANQVEGVFADDVVSLCIFFPVTAFEAAVGMIVHLRKALNVDVERVAGKRKSMFCIQQQAVFERQRCLFPDTLEFEGARFLHVRVELAGRKEEQESK